MAAQTASTVRAAALRSRCLSLAKTCSIGFRSGEYFGRQEQLGAGRADELAYDLAPVAAEIVHDDDVAGPQRGQQNLLDIGGEAFAVDRAFEQPGRGDPVVAQRGQEGHGPPAAVRDLGDQAAAARRPAAQRRHVGPGPGLVDEDQAGRINAVLVLDPLRPPARDVRTVLFASHQRFFLKLSFSSWTKVQTER